MGRRARRSADRRRLRSRVQSEVVDSKPRPLEPIKDFKYFRMNSYDVETEAERKEERGKKKSGKDGRDCEGIFSVDKHVIWYMCLIIDHHAVH